MVIYVYMILTIGEIHAEQVEQLYINILLDCPTRGPRSGRLFASWIWLFAFGLFANLNRLIKENLNFDFNPENSHCRILETGERRFVEGPKQKNSYQFF